MQPLILGHAAGTPLLGATWRPGGYRPRSPARTLLGRDLGRREAREVTDLVPVVDGAELRPRRTPREGLSVPGSAGSSFSAPERC